MDSIRTFTDQEIDAFVTAQSKGHFMQSPRWGKVKSEWRSRVLVSTDQNGEILSLIHISEPTRP